MTSGGHAGAVVRVSGAQLQASTPQDALAAFETAVLRLHWNGVHRCVLAGLHMLVAVQPPAGFACLPHGLDTTL